jgi:hypothetical protein
MPYFAYLDEFGHIGPFISPAHETYKESPAFGLGGVILPHHTVRSFGTWFFQQKCRLLDFEIKRASVHPATWEKKGSALYTVKNISKYRELRRTTDRILNQITKLGGFVFYVGLEKATPIERHNPNKLYFSVLREALKRLDEFAASQQEEILVIMDEHPSRSDLLTVAAQEMYGQNRRRWLIEPPFQVESHRYQTCQCADWICGLVGRLAQYELRPDEYPEMACFETYFGNRLRQAAARSGFRRAKKLELSSLSELKSRFESLLPV